MNESTPRALVRELLEVGFAQRDARVIERLVAADYIQHSPYLPTGRQGLLQLLDELARLPENTFRVMRTIEDGELVLLHSEWRPASARRAVFDLFRVVDGRLVEHWDLMQDAPLAAAGAFAGPALVVERERTEVNRACVARFIRDVLLGGAGRARDRFLDSVDPFAFVRHTVDGDEHADAQLAELERGGSARIEARRLHRLVADGNFVFAHLEGTIDDVPSAFGELYRLAAGKIVEQWTIRQAIPDCSLHANGMF